MGLRSKVELI